MEHIVEEHFIPLFLDYFKRSEKKKAEQKIGFELELIGFRGDDLTRLTLDNLQTVLQRFNKENDWKPVFESGVILEMHKGISKISLEPGLQLEFSTNPHVGLKEIEEELVSFRDILKTISDENGWIWYCMGYDPYSKPDEMPWNPKKRYEIMRRYLPAFGKSVLRMMPGTAGAQVNLDYSGEGDMTQKMAVSSAIGIIVGAMFSNSCISENSTSIPAIRSEIWNDIDPVRTGYIDDVLTRDFNYLKYIRYILNVPMLVLKKNGLIEDYSGKDFKEYLMRNGENYEPSDWVTQLSVTFPFSRLRNTIEVRTADSGNIAHNMALCAFWKGLFYHEDSLKKAYVEVCTYTTELLNQIRCDMPYNGLKTKFGSLEIRDKAAFFLNLSKEGLSKLAPEEVHYLEYLERIVSSGSSAAEQIITEMKKKPDNNITDIAQSHNLVFC